MKTNKNLSMKELLTEWRKVLRESKERDLTEDEIDTLRMKLQFLGSTAFYSEPNVYITPQGDVGVDGLQIGFIDTGEDQRGDGPGGEYYPPFVDPPAFMENNEDRIGGWVADLWMSDFDLIDYELTGYSYNGPELGNGFAEVNLVLSADAIADSE